MKQDDAIGSTLNLEPLEVEIVEDVKPVMAIEMQNQELNKDYTYARDNFYNVIEKGTTALEQMLEVARASEHPRAYEVVSTIMKTLLDANKDLVDLASKKSDQIKPVDHSPGTVNNNLFVGSTADLQKMLKDLRDGSD